MHFKVSIVLSCFVLMLCLFMSSCGTKKAAYFNESNIDWNTQVFKPSNKLIHELIIIGDAGSLDDTIKGTNIVLDAISKQITTMDAESSLVYLGDNIYPEGLVKKKNSERAHGEKILKAQLDLVKDFKGKTYYIPGNHDWNNQKAGGRKAILRQEKFVENYFDDKKKIKFYPKDACADPKDIKINKDLVFVFIDSQWWLQNWQEEKNMNDDCDIKSRGDLLESIEEIFVDHKNDEIVLMMHHPIKSNGLHGGNFNLTHHIFPFQDLNNWIPLPIIGSLYPMYRKVTGSKQDIAHILNKELMQELRSMAKTLRINVLFISGHDHGLQYFEEEDLKYIVSGAGAKSEYTKRGGDASYARDARGFAKVKFYEDSEAWVEFYTVTEKYTDPVLDFRAQIRPPRPGTVEEEKSYPPISLQTKTIAPNEDLGAGPIKKAFLGKQYRDIWVTPVKAEVIDLETKLGGLKPIKKGGGMASNSLRMEATNEHQYILRSIKKDYTKLVPANFQNLKLIDVIADQNSASHPYSALIIPTLSKAAKVYYTEPKLVYLKHQRGLGNYNSQFPEELYLLEERPDGDWTDDSKFGNSDDIMSYADLLKILREKKNHFVDQEWVLKSRMFDLFIHDWDRHDDQWRWASFKIDGKNIYRPIPRDRDQAFYKFVGVIPWYLSTFVMQQFKTMKDDVKDVKHLSLNAKHFDRYFLNELDWSRWKIIINQMQQDIKDIDIETSMESLPKEIEGMNDEELIIKLKSRRDKLESIGRKLYDYLSEEVEITGTDNKDDFTINILDNESVNVSYTVKSDDGILEKYNRTFYNNETKEIRIYGLRGKDEFNISGDHKSKIRIRIIGGEDNDEFSNTSKQDDIYIYDDLDGMTIEGLGISKMSSDLNVNEYDRKAFQYNTSLPFLTLGFTQDDRFWFGASYSWTKLGWRRSPYKSQQSVSFSLAPGGQDALQLGYEGHFPKMLGSLDFSPSVDIQYPHYQNYFGLGNNSINNLREIQYNWVRIQSVELAPLLQYDLGRSSHLKFGPLFRSHAIQRRAGRVDSDEFLGFTDQEVEGRKYIGGQIKHQFEFVDSHTYPTNGFKLNTSFSYLNGLDFEEQFNAFHVNGNIYIKIFNKPSIVFAHQIGYQKSWGQLQFYQYPSLGNNTFLRGFRNERFRGESAFYHNMDLRFQIIKWRNNIIPMDIGFLVGYDYGRVWLSGEESEIWHNSLTFGISLELLGAVVLQPYYSWTNEENVISFRFGFNF